MEYDVFRCRVNEKRDRQEMIYIDLSEGLPSCVLCGHEDIVVFVLITGSGEDRYDSICLKCIRILHGLSNGESGAALESEYEVREPQVEREQEAAAGRDGQP
jgi:hypothetical protein